MTIIRAVNRVKSARLERRLGQRELAEQAGISRQALGAIESGAYNPSVSVAMALARVLGQSVEGLFGESAPESLTATLAAVTRAPEETTTHVALARVAGKLLAVPRPQAGLSLLPASGMVARRLGNKVEVAAFRSRAEIDATLLVAGCDPAVALLADWLAHRAPFVALVNSQCPSMRALEVLAAGECHVAGVHLRNFKGEGYNSEVVAQKFAHRHAVVVRFARWELGLASRPHERLRIRGLADLLQDGVRIANRPAGAGARAVLDEGLAELGADPARVAGYTVELQGHLEVAARIAEHAADAGLTLRVAAEAFGLDFAPLREERYDLVIPKRELDAPPVVAMLEALNQSRLAAEVARLCFYDTREMGSLAEL